jgi:cytochrome c biogenesis protein CcdA/thiol-disulfide isomerase/thioredoxin
MELLIIGLIGGLITGISPCVIPVLPVIFFSGGTEAARDGVTTRNPFTGRRPYLVILGLVVSFSLFTLAGSFLLSLLHLPQETIIWVGIVALLLVGIGMIVPSVERLLERAFSWIPQREVSTDRNGFLLGIALGAVYVPCAGPVLAAISVAGASGSITPTTLLLTLTFAIGVAIPLLIFALAGRGIAERIAAFRRHQRGIRIVAGVALIILAVGVIPAFNLPKLLLTAIPDYTAALQNAAPAPSKSVGFGSDKTSSTAKSKTNSSSAGASTQCAAESTNLVNCGAAPEFKGITNWFNTADNKPITLASLKGKVVLVDFWAYSCINCQRYTPHLNAWYSAYQKAGFVVVGLHAPEYAFEHVAANVKASAAQQGIRFPVGLDNDFTTWTEYGNQSWPADYLIDASGNVRHISFGEGAYANTEKLIRSLLKSANPSVSLPAATEVTDATPTHTLTPETYLGSDRVPATSFASPSGYQKGTYTYAFPTSSLPQEDLAFSGKFTTGAQTLESDSNSSKIRLHYQAQHVYLDVGGTGTLTVTDSAGTRTIPVSGPPDIRDVLTTGGYRNGIVTITMSAGLTAYSFTFG